MLDEWRDANQVWGCLVMLPLDVPGERAQRESNAATSAFYRLVRARLQQLAASNSRASVVWTRVAHAALHPPHRR